MALELATRFSWNLEIERDGSGRIRAFGWPDSTAYFPEGTFNFPRLCRALAERCRTTGDPRHDTKVLRHTGAAPSMSFLHEEHFVARLFEQACRAPLRKEPQFDRLQTELPLLL